MDRQEGAVQNTKSKSVLGAFEWVESIVFALVFVIVIFSFLFRIVVVEGPSMQPTLEGGDRLILSTLFFDPQPGDIVVIAKTGANDDNKPIIKRVIATEGQTVDIDFEAGIVTVDGEELNEPYINELTNRKYEVDFPLTVDEGCYFVMGDNRNHSADSRTTKYGQIKRGEITGEVIFRIYPFDKAGRDFGSMQ